MVELEEKGFLAPRGERFRRVTTGVWKVAIESARKTKAEVPEPVRWLTERGVTAATAQSLAAAKPPERIRHHVEAFDWLVSKRDARALRNAPGFLACSIREDYAAPQGFVLAEERAEKAKTDRVSKQEENAEKKRTEASEAEAARAESEAFARAWNGLPHSERIRIEKVALASANRLQREILQRGGAFAEATRRSLLKRFLTSPSS